MTDYEVELGTVTEQWNAKTDTLYAVSVDVHVRAAEEGAGDARSGTYTVRYDVEDGVARFEEIDAGPGVDDLALVAIRAATEQLADVTEASVIDPIGQVQDSDYELLDALP